MSRVDTNPPAPAAGHRAGPRTPVATASSDMSLSLSSPKIRPWHLERKAIVYVRQSTPQQVLDHRESADRQYGLVQRAAALGWPRGAWTSSTRTRAAAARRPRAGPASSTCSPRSASTTSA